MRTYGLRTLLPALLAVSASFPPAFAQTPIAALTQTAQPQADRISAASDLTTLVRLSGHVPAWAAASADRGAIPDDTQLHLIISLSRAPQLQAAFNQLTADQQNPSSPRFHQWLTPQQIGEQFGPTQNDLTAVSNWLSSQGLHVDATTPSRVYIQASASAAVVSAAFQTSLHTFAFGDRTLQAAVAEPAIPAGLQPIVSYISGLAPADRHRNLSRAAVVSVQQAGIHLPGAPASANPNVNLGSGVHWLLPADFATIYDLNPAYSANITGSSQKIMIIGGSRLLAADLTSWESISGLPSYQPNYIVPSGSGFSDPGTTSDDNQGEGTLDFERAYGTAPGAVIDQIISKNWLNGTTSENLILYAINTVNDPILSMSFGSCEAQQTASYVNYESSVFQQAAVQGISVFASSGDSGVAGCEQQGAAPPATQTASISDICASPYVTCVGGTEFSDTANPNAFWSGTNSTANNGSALMYIPEGVWNEPTSTSSSGTVTYVVASGGGGSSTVIAKPNFQVATGVPTDGARDVPDVSFSASVHNAFLACLAYANADCTKYVTGFGGTSASAPSMAGITAMLDQKLNGRQGNINPLLYKIYTSSFSAFHDATPATSGVSPCSTATPSTCNNSNASPTGLTGGIAGYALTPGYDLATGLGSLDVSAFLTASATAPALAATTDTLTASPTTITTAQTAVFTAAIASTTSGTPTGSVQFSINGTPTGSAITLTGGQAVTASIPFPTAGTYTISAAYSGDAVYAASPATLNFTVTVPTLPATTTTLVGTASSITTQQTVSYTATVAPPSGNTGTPTGTVQFVRTSAGTATDIGSPIPLAGGKATLPATSLPAGAYSISGIYSGDANFTGSTSPGVPLTVSAIPTTTSIALLTSPNVTSIQPVTFTATVAVGSGSTGTPTGNIQFLVDGIGRGYVALSGNTATSAPITFTPGGHSVNAIYDGDSIFASSTSGFDAVTSTIQATAIAFTTIAASIPQFTGTPITATVSGLSASVATSAGVTFRDTTTGTTLATPTVTYSGTTATATLTAAFTTTGNHAITAMFTGDPNYSASNTASATISVTAAPTYTLAAGTPSLTLASASSASGTDVITAVSSSGFTGTISFTCGVALTSGASATVPPTCNLNPASISFPSATSTTVTIGTVAPHSISSQSASLRTLAQATGVAMASLFLSTLPFTRRRNWKALAGLLLTAGSLVGLSGCGSGSSSTPIPSGGTTTGVYTVTVTGTTTTGIPVTTTTFALTVN